MVSEAADALLLLSGFGERADRSFRRPVATASGNGGFPPKPAQGQGKKILFPSLFAIARA
jgi:hypothetical protein